MWIALSSPSVAVVLVLSSKGVYPLIIFGREDSVEACVLVVIFLGKLVVRQQVSVDVAVEQVVFSQFKEYLRLRQV